MFSVTKKFSSICKDIADAIRSKLEIDTKIKLKDFPDYIEAIEQNDIETFLDNNSTYFKYLGAQSEHNITDLYLKTLIFPKISAIKSFSRAYSVQKIFAPKCGIVNSSALAGMQELSFIQIPACSIIHANAFEKCYKLSTISLPNATLISASAFKSCYRLLDLTLPSSQICQLYDTNAFYSTPISGYFREVSKYGSIFVPASLLSAYKSATNWAIYSSRFAEIEKKAKINSIQTIKNVFIEIANYFRAINKINSNITPALIPSATNSLIPNKDYTAIRDGKFISYSNSQITKINYNFFAPCLTKNYIFENCTTITTGAFRSARTLSTIDLPVCTEIPSSAFANCRNLTSINLPKCSLIYPDAFYECCSLSNINLSLCKQILQRAFYRCSNLSILDAPNCGGIGIGAFQECASLAQVHLGDTIETGTTIVADSAFASCHRLSNINLSFCVGIMPGAFLDCWSLSSIDLPKCTLIESFAFARCSSLSSINLPQCIYVKSYAFSGCSSLSRINLPACTSIEDFVFKDCSSLQVINLPACPSFSTLTFYSCSNLKVLNLPNCLNIKSYALSCLSSLTAINLFACESIGASAFYSCYNLISIYLGASSVCSLFSTNAFDATPMSNYIIIAGKYGSIFVPSSLFDAYQNATNWAVYSSRFATIEDNPLPSEFTS